ncbi:MAG: hypothetical protein ACM3JK_04820 [Betaproteobacteria bacterium]
MSESLAEDAMDKEFMINRLMREIESDFSFELRLGLIDRARYDGILEEEKALLFRKNYTEIEMLFLKAAA